VSEDLDQITDDWGVSVTDDFLVVKVTEDLVDPWVSDELVDIKVDVVDVQALNVVVVVSAAELLISEDGVNINDMGGHDPADDFLDVDQGELLEDGVELGGNAPGDEELLEENFLHDQVTLGLNDGVLELLGLGDDLLVNLDIDDLGWLNNNLGLSGKGLNNDFLVGGLDLDVSPDLGDLSDSWAVKEKGLVDLVHQISGIVDLRSEDGLAENWGLDSVVPVAVDSIPGPWVEGLSFVSVSVKNAVEVVSEGHISLEWSDVFLSLDIVVDVVLVVDVRGGWDVLGDDLDLGNDVLVEEDRVPEVRLELGDGPELLEEGRLNISPEDDWVLDPELTEEGDPHVLPEEVGVDQLLNGEDLDLPVDPRVDIVALLISVDGGVLIAIAGGKEGRLGEGWDSEPVVLGEGQGQVVLQEGLLL